MRTLRKDGGNEQEGKIFSLENDQTLAMFFSALNWPTVIGVKVIGDLLESIVRHVI